MQVMLASLPASPPPTTGEICTELCGAYSIDGSCDDGGHGAEFNICSAGTDCADCGPRVPAMSTKALPPPALPEPPLHPAPHPPPPLRTPAAQVRALEALYEATDGASWFRNLGWMSGDPCADRWWNDDGHDLCIGNDVTNMCATHPASDHILLAASLVPPCPPEQRVRSSPLLHLTHLLPPSPLSLIWK